VAGLAEVKGGAPAVAAQAGVGPALEEAPPAVRTPVVGSDAKRLAAKGLIDRGPGIDQLVDDRQPLVVGGQPSAGRPSRSWSKPIMAT
jgi:hypothetical protein